MTNPNPVSGIRIANSASDGIVYRIPVTPMIGPLSQRRRWARIASAKAMTKPIATEDSVSSTWRHSGAR